jgi:colanic acid/amylovoran biosynthesis glycosyltransferase
MLRKPGRLFDCFRYAFRLSGGGLKVRMRTLALIPSASELARICLRENINHVHFHSCGDSAHVGALVGILENISYSVTVHGDLPVYGSNHAEKFAGASVVTAVTRPLAEQVSAVRPGVPVPVISMGVDVDRFRPQADAGGDPPPGSALFVSVSRLNHTKGHACFLEAMRGLVDEGLDVRYAIAGAGPARQEIEDKIDSLGLEDRASLLGPLGQGDIIRLLQDADAFVLTSFGLGEAAPVAVMEAMACGTPIVCSAIGGTTDMIEDGLDGFLVPQQDVARIREAARRIAADPSLRRRMGQAARKKAVAAFDYHVKARELLDVLTLPEKLQKIIL